MEVVILKGGFSKIREIRRAQMPDLRAWDSLHLAGGAPRLPQHDSVSLVRHGQTIARLGGRPRP